ncbi:MAG: rod shape-determining protein MreC [Arcobacteraceae bacterium]|nr:rod shape-determining protein MreC [Arcobacteraceae bacterium]
MNKNFFIILFIGIALLYIFNINNYISSVFTSFTNGIKGKYIDTFVDSGNFIAKYFNQANAIEELRNENQELKEYRLLYESSVKELEHISQVLTWESFGKPDLTLTKVISYKQANDPSQMWIDYEIGDKIVGLIYDNYAAGIAIGHENKTLALLNNNEKANYGVLIGEEKATGITHGGDNMGNVLIKYIPLWQNFAVGDKVYTSGMDGIFFEGLLVGEIISIKEGVNTYEAYMKPYVSPSKKRFFYVCEIKSLEVVE